MYEIPRNVVKQIKQTLSTIHPLVLVIASYLLLAVIFFWPSWLAGKVPLPLTNAYVQDDPAWSGFPPAEVAEGANPVLTDVSDFYYPYLVFTTENLRKGIFPLWNPAYYGGKPYFAGNEPALLFPINLLTFWFGPHWYWVIAATLRLVIGGTGMYLFLRRLHAHPLGAWLAGGIYIFALFNVAWIHFAVHNVAMLLPLALWLIVDLVERPRRWPALALAGLVMAQMFGGHPETSVSFLLICAIFTAVWLLGRNLRQLLAAATVIGAAVALGLALSVVQWLPTLAIIPTAPHTIHRATLVRQAMESGEPFSPLGGVRYASWGNLRNWLLFVAPELWGAPRGELTKTHNGNKIRYWLPNTNYNEMAVYVGLVALPLAVAGALRSPQRRAAWLFAALVVLPLTVHFALPGFYLIGYLPLMQVAYGLRMGFWISLALAVLAGLGVSWLLTANRRALVAVAAGSLLLAMVNFAVAYDLWDGVRATWALGFAPDDTTRQMLREAYGWSHLRPILPGAAGVIAGVILLVAAFGFLPVKRAVIMLMLIAVAEPLAFGFGYNGFTRPDVIYPQTEATRWLHEQPGMFRIINPDGAFAASKVMAVGLQGVTAVEALVPPDQHWFVEQGWTQFPWIKRRVVVKPNAQRLMDLMNVRYLATRQSSAYAPDGPTLHQVFKDGNVRLYDNPTALPRAYAATSVIQTTHEQAQATVFDPAFDPHTTVALEGAAPPDLVANPPTAITPVAITTYGPNQVELEAKPDKPSIVVLLDAYDPDWRVTINGQDAQVLRVNAIFRGVLVPPGEAHIVFRYVPRLVWLGGGVSVLAALAWVLIACWPLLRRPMAAPVRRRATA